MILLSSSLFPLIKKFSFAPYIFLKVQSWLCTPLLICYLPLVLCPGFIYFLPVVIVPLYNFRGRHYILIHVNATPRSYAMHSLCVLWLWSWPLFSCYSMCQAAHWTLSLGCPIVTSNLSVKSDWITLPPRLVAFPHLSTSIQRNSIQPVLKLTS